MEKEANEKTSRTKKRGMLHLIRVTLFMIKGRSARKSAGKGGLWKTLVTAMLPMHHLPQSALPTPASSDMFHGELLPPASPAPSSINAGDISRYTSAEDLPALERGGRSADNGLDGGDDGIDLKAEEFIARFYEQMRLQRLDSINGYTYNNNNNLVKGGAR